MGKIVAVGGGDIEKDARRINREIVALSGKVRPRALYIPTASRDNPESYEAFRRAFGRLGCTCEQLLLLDRRPSRAEIRERIGWADIIWVGGGNTLLMMRRWRFLGVDRELRRAHRRGAVLSGASAGSICWFEWGHSDSMRGYGHDPWDYVAVRGLGLLAGGHCPHYHHEDREAKFHEMIRKRGRYGVAIDDGAALAVVDGRYRVLTALPNAGVYVVRGRRGQVLVRGIASRRMFEPLAGLYAP